MPRAEIVYVLCLVVERLYMIVLGAVAVAVKSGKIFQPLLVNRTAHIVAFCKKRLLQQNMTFYMDIFLTLLVNTCHPYRAD